MIEKPLLNSLKLAIDLMMLVLAAPVIAAFGLASLAPWWRRRPPAPPRVVWGSQPIRALAEMRDAAALGGWPGTVVVREHSPIYTSQAFDHVVLRSNPFRVLDRLLDSLTAYWFFARALVRFDVFVFYFDGGLLRRTLLEPVELPLLKLLRKRIVLIPYGSDTWVLDHTPNLLWRAALLIDYRGAGIHARKVERQVRRGCRYADCVLGCLVHIACLPRWDVLPLTCYPIDTARLEPTLPKTTGTVRIAHSANHRGFKGTDFLIAAVERLRAAGYDVELDVIERTPNEEVLRRVSACDVYVDQLVAGYAYAALEAMALGKVVLSPLDDSDANRVFRRYSYLDECPIVDVSIETVERVLKDLIDRRVEWPEIGRASRAFCERRHSIAANAELWDAIFRRVWAGEDIDLINLYHPLFEPRRALDPA